MAAAGLIRTTCVAGLLAFQPCMAAGQESPSSFRPSTPVPRVGTFVLDLEYPSGGRSTSRKFNFGTARQELALPQEVIYFLFQLNTDVFREARRKGLKVLSRMGACESLEDRPSYGYQQIGGEIRPLTAAAGISRYVDKTTDTTLIFVPVFRNLRLYEPNSRIAYEWLERVTTEGGLCLDVGLRGKMFGSRQLFEVDLTKYARFTYE